MDDDKPSAHVFSKSCPHDGCVYVSKSTSKASAEHNLGSHTSNVHGQRTKVWYGATQVTILRDLKTKTMSCPCGNYIHINAAVVRTHALKNHKGSDKVPRGSSPAASSSVAEQSAPSSPSPADPPPRPPPRRTVNRLSGPPDFTRLKADRKSLSTLAACGSTPRQPAQNSASVAGSSTKAHTPSDEQPVSAWRERLLASIHRPSDSKDKNVNPLRRLSAPFAPAAGSSTQARKRAQEEEVDSGRPAKAPRVESGSHSWRDIIMPMALTQQLSRPRQVAKKSGRQPNALFRDLTPEEVETPDFEDDEPASGQPEAQRPVSGERTCCICSRTVMCNLKFWENHPEFTCSKCVLKGAAAAKAKAPVSSNAERGTSHSPVVAPSPASATPRPKPRPRPRAKRSDVASVPDAPKQPAAAGYPTQDPAVTFTSQPAPPRRAVVDPPSPVAGPSSEPEGVAHPFEAPSDPEADPPQPAPEKPKRRRVTKKMRAGAFRGWFDGVLADLHAKQAAGALDVDRNDYLKVRLIEQHGGTAYTTQEQFLAALRRCIVAFERGKAEGRRERMAFRAGYSIVAQPKIKHKERGESVMQLLRAMGLTLDEAGSREMTSYSSHTSGAFEEEHMWSFPCTCAGSPVPKKQGKPTALEKRASPCGGTIGLHVGDDFALEAYGIKGQSIRLEVNHHYRAGASGGSRA